MKISNIENVNITKPIKLKLDNGIEVSFLETGNSEILHLEFLFEGGTYSQPIKHSAEFLASMLNEGTSKFTAKEIAEKFEFYGASFSGFASNHHSGFHVEFLYENLEKILEILKFILLDSIFPQKELNITRANLLQQYQRNLKNNAYVASQEMSKSLFGKDHPYNDLVNTEAINALKSSDLISYYQQTFAYNNCKIIIAGRNAGKALHLVNQFFGSDKWNPTTFEPRKPLHINSQENPYVEIQGEGPIQTAIAMGTLTINDYHEDYPYLFFLNFLFGGHSFSTRLMKNLRVEKGYTYGAYSNLDPELLATSLIVETEVDSKYTTDSIKQIFLELNKLTTTLPTQEEVTVIKNYLMARFNRSFDGLYPNISLLRLTILNNRNEDFYVNLVHKIKEVTPQILLETAKKHIVTENFKTVVVKARE